MSTVHHTPYAADSVLDAAPDEVPFGQLDAQLVVHDGQIAAAQSAITALTLNGSGWTTTLDNTANSGQRVVPVTATGTFTSGQSVMIRNADGSGTPDVGVINTVSAGVSVTLVDTLVATYAAGAIISASPVELVLARGGYATLNARLQAQNFDVRAYGALGNGVHDDTAAITAAIAALTAAGRGGLYFPAGNYKVTSTLTIAVPVTIYGAGAGSTDLVEYVSRISYTSTTTDCIVVTSKYASLHDISIVNTSGVAATAGAGFHFAYGGAYQFPTFEVHHVTIAFFYTGLSSDVAEAAVISDSRFLGMYYDGILLGDVAPYNSGDTVVSNNFFTASASAANAAIDFQGSTNARIFGNKVVRGLPSPAGSFNYGVFVGSHIAQALMIIGNDIENVNLIPLSLGADCTDDLIEGNCLVQNTTSGPGIVLGSSQNVTIGLNLFVNATGATIAEAILFAGPTFNSVVMPQSICAAYSGGGYTAAQSGLGLYLGSDNSDLSSLTNLTLPNLTLNSGSGATGTLTANIVTAPTSYPIVINAAAGQNLRVRQNSIDFLYAAPNALYPAADNVMELGDHVAAWTTVYSHAAQVLPRVVSALPAASSTTEGMMIPVTNSNTDTWGATIAGGGTYHVLAYCDGTNWTVTAK